jgi:hypothetical protein
MLDQGYREEKAEHAAPKLLVINMKKKTFLKQIKLISQMFHIFA